MALLKEMARGMLKRLLRLAIGSVKGSPLGFAFLKQLLSSSQIN
jgi:hypothetical protein